MGGLLDIFFNPPPQTPIKNPCIRLGNIVISNFRGILGSIFPVIILPVLFEKDRHDKTIQAMWLIMLWIMWIQPVCVPMCGVIPIFILPMFGVASSTATCNCYFNSGMTLYIVGGYLTFLLNNSGLDRRMILWFLNLGKAGEVSSMGLMIKASFAAFLTSMLSHRLQATALLMQCVADPLLSLETTKESPGETSINSLRYILANAIQTSSSIGSLTILHSSYATLAFRAMYELGISYSTDVFNFLQYSLFAIPTAILMFIVNLLYHIVLVKIVAKGPIGASSVSAISTSLTTAKEAVPKSITTHEILSIISLLLVLVTYCTRWNMIFKRLNLGYGWSEFSSNMGSPLVLDATVASIFAVVLHVIPNSFKFLKLCGKLRESQLPNKPESAILFWRYVDKNTNYGYIFLIGSGIALNMAIETSLLTPTIVESGQFITNLNFTIGLLLICLITVFMSNMISSVAALVIILPFVMNMIPADPEWSKNSCLACLAVGMGTSLGFALPFRFTPAFFVKTVAKVPLLKQVKYSIVSSILCTLILWVMVAFYGPLIFIEKVAEGETTTEAA